MYFDSKAGMKRRHHLDESVSEAIKEAVQAAGMTKRGTAHTLRHRFGAQLLDSGYDIRTVQELLGQCRCFVRLKAQPLGSYESSRHCVTFHLRIARATRLRIETSITGWRDSDRAVRSRRYNTLQVATDRL